MFELGDRVRVNLGAKGTHNGTVAGTRNTEKLIAVDLDNGKLAIVDPWDVFHIEEETE